MRKNFPALLSSIFLVIIAFFLFSTPRQVHAADQVNFTVTQDPNPAYQNSGTIKLTLTAPSDVFLDGQRYAVTVKDPDEHDPRVQYSSGNQSGDALQFHITPPRTAEIDIQPTGVFGHAADYPFSIYYDKPGSNNLLYSGQFTISAKGGTNGLPQIRPEQNTYQVKSPIVFDLINIDADKNYVAWWNGSKSYVFNDKFSEEELTSLDGFPSGKINVTAPSDAGTPKLCMDQTSLGILSGGTVINLDCRYWVKVNITTLPPNQQELNTPISTSNDPGIPTDTGPQVTADTPTPPTPPCPPEAYNSITGKCAFVHTGLGFDINTEPAGFVESIFGLLLSISGGIALLLIIYSGYQMVMSRGKPETLQAARDRLTSAIVGLLFLIFSLAILQIIGVDILHIPNFNQGTSTIQNASGAGN